MKYITHNEKGEIDANGTYLQGYIETKYKDLKRLFGEPEDGDGYKIDAEWIIKFEDNTIATIYNHKDGKNYRGEEGIPINEIELWHIGGFEKKAIDYIKELLKK